jgi:hypothetical protein
MVATDDRLGRPGARLLHGAGRGRRPQGLRCAHRQAPAAALDPVVLAQQVAVMPCGAHRVRRRQGVSFLLCAPGDICILRRQHGPEDPRRRAFRAQRKVAHRRCIAFVFTFDQSSAWWQVDGRWQRRGNHKGQLMMGCLGDTRPFRISRRAGPPTIPGAGRLRRAAVCDESVRAIRGGR